jgi:2-polyprenyl-6-methoxyphenol hydroxylase-like FAD-dependent oxidoreductase
MTSTRHQSRAANRYDDRRAEEATVKTTSDVLIVGAGPVGLALAGLLGRHGVTSTIVESRLSRTPRDESRAITWMPEGLLAADELGITDELHDRAVVRRYHDFLDRPGGVRLLTLDMAALGHRYGHTLNLPQGDTEEVLEHAALAGRNVDILRGVEPIAVASRPDGVTANLRDLDGVEMQVRARFGVGADGAHSPRTGVAHMAGLSSRWRDYGMDSVVADLELAVDPAATDRSWIALDPDRPLGAFAFGPRRWRLVYRVNSGESRDLATSEGFVAEQLARAFPGVPAERHLWASAFRLGQAQTEAYVSGRWALVGDAAHAMGPSAGAGMQVGVLGAWRLSQQLIGALREPATWPARAHAYEAAQRTVSVSVQRSNARTFRAMAVTSPRVAAVRAAALRGVGRLPLVARKITADAALDGLAPRGSGQEEPAVTAR